MKSFFKLLPLLLVATILIFCVYGCTDNSTDDVITPDPSEDNPQDDDPQDNPQDDNPDESQLTAEERFWRGVLDDVSAYQLIRSADLDGNPRLMAQALRYSLQSISGKTIKLYSDINVESQAKEIIIGVTERLGDSYTSEIEDGELDADGYVIEYIEETAIVHYGGFEGLALAVKEIIGYICQPSGKDANAMYKTAVNYAGVSPGNVTLTNVYANGMVFQSNKPVVLKGFADAGNMITAELINADGQTLSSAKSEVSADGKWGITLDGMSGSYDAYKVRFSVAGIEVLTLSDIVFGEVWIATGQSNMLYQLSKDAEYKNLTINDKYMKLLTISKPRSDGGYSPVPFEENGNPTVRWSSGRDVAGRMSALAYYYAASLREELDVPVGIIQYAIGGVPIRSWLSDETIKSDPELFAHYKSNGTYVTPDRWNDDNNARKFASAFYNTMACVAKDLGIAGLIWYQGEQDIIEDAAEIAAGKPSTYITELELLYSQYSEMYGFEEGEMPMVYNLLVPYRNPTSPVYFGEFTANFATFAKAHEKVTAIAIYDQSPYYDSDNTADHPNSKRLAAERMAASALALVYGKDTPIASPAPVSYLVSEGAVIITFDNVCDGLVIHNATGSTTELAGFTICGADGVYVMAKAEIISNNQVKVWSEHVSSPVSVTYAYEILQRNFNLGCQKDGKVCNMAIPFCLGEPEDPKHTSYFHWMSCDLDKIWRVYSNYSYELPLWNDVTPDGSGKNITLTHDTSVKHSGSASLKITHTGSGSFGIGVTSTYYLTNTLGTAQSNINFNDTYKDLSGFSKLVFYVKSEGATDLRLTGVKLESFSVEISADSPCDGNISGNGEWHKVVIDLTSPTMSGVSYTNAALTSVDDFSFIFQSETSGTVYVDSFSLIP